MRDREKRIANGAWCRVHGAERDRLDLGAGCGMQNAAKGIGHSAFGARNALRLGKFQAPKSKSLAQTELTAKVFNASNSRLETDHGT